VLSLEGMIPLANVTFAWSESNLAGKVIVFILVAGSIFTWSVLLTKFKELMRAKMLSSSFLRAYHKGDNPTSIFLSGETILSSPLSLVYQRVCKTLSSELEVAASSSGSESQGGRLDSASIGTVRATAERCVAEQALALESSMGFLATATTTAPFLGLLGTVWGVMDSFGGMGQSGAAMLTDVAPGISGALLTTVVGLLVALPSAVGYNVLSDKIRRLSVETENFSQELVADIERSHCR
jgi:biopolymer transport protein TolQ